MAVLALHPSTTHHALTPVVLLPLYALLAAAGCLATPPTASLAAGALSAGAVWLYGLYRMRRSTSRDDATGQQQAWAVGVLLALALACRRAAGEGKGIWWSEALVPWAVVLAGVLGGRRAEHWDRTAGLLLLAGTASAAYVLDLRVTTLGEATLAACHAVLTGAALDRLVGLLADESAVEGKKRPVALDGLQCSDGSDGVPWDGVPWDGVRLQTITNVCGCLAISCALLSWLFEGPWTAGHVSVQTLTTLGLASTALAPALYLLFAMTAQKSVRDVSLWTLAAVVIAAIFRRPGWNAICAGRLVLEALFQAQTPATTERSRRLKAFSWLTCGLAATLLGFRVLVASVGPGTSAAFPQEGLLPAVEVVGGSMQIPEDIHPIKYLVSQAEEHFESLLGRQPKSLAESTTAYRTRYGIPPPPRFDKWYEFAKKHDVRILDDYDIVDDAMRPFWALKPSTIRRRVQEAIGFDENALIVLMIRDGRITTLRGGLEWQREALSGMLESFVGQLPDLDVAFNAHDEPRVIVPHEDLARMITMGAEGSRKNAAAATELLDVFSSRPSDMTDGLSIREYKASRFNEYAHQTTWLASRLSCPPDSPARAMDEDGRDATATYELGPLGFIYNHTASTDICQIPSLHGTHAFFDRPNAFSVSHDLVPVFSESKISSFQDIPFPSMWHWYGRLFVNRTEDMHLHSTPAYEPETDVPWEAKSEDLYWRGSTTGAYSQAGGWRRHHRQRMLQQLNSPGSATILHDAAAAAAATSSTASAPRWRPMSVRRPDLAHLLNVSFTGVGQCAEADCAAQREFFAVEPHAPARAAWRHRHLLDMDGNAFSARFYALLRSGSLVYKAALFREWHAERLVPWLHFVPLGLAGRGHDDALEAVRFFATEADGRGAARRLADAQRTWAGAALRREDMEAWMFRCLLEYARVVDDERDLIGFPG